MYHHTKTKGDIGVFKAMADIACQGFCICLPQTEHAPFDIAAYKDGEFRRIQVKYRSEPKRKGKKLGAISVMFRSCASNSNGWYHKKIDKNKVDIYCIYCPETNECYYIDPKKYNKSVSLRITSESLNGQITNINFAKNFRNISDVW